MNIDLFIGGELILSQESVTQGAYVNCHMKTLFRFGMLMMPRQVADYRAFGRGGTN